MTNKIINDELDNIFGGSIEGGLWYFRVIDLDTNEPSSWRGGYSSREEAQKAFEEFCVSKPGRYKFECKNASNGFVPEYEEPENN